MEQGGSAGRGGAESDRAVFVILFCASFFGAIAMPAGHALVPSYSTHVINSSANGALSVYATDVDSDGDMDVLSASYLDDKIAWYETAVMLARTFESPAIIVVTDGTEPELEAIITSALYKAPLIYVAPDGVPEVGEGYLRENKDAKIVYGPAVGEGVKSEIAAIVG